MNIRAMLAADIITNVIIGNFTGDQARAEFTRRGAKGGKSAARAAKNLARLGQYVAAPQPEPQPEPVVDDHLERNPVERDANTLALLRQSTGSWGRAYYASGWGANRICAARAYLGSPVKPNGVSVAKAKAKAEADRLVAASV